MKNVVILGASGMLGAMLLRQFGLQDDFKVTATVRRKDAMAGLGNYDNVEFAICDAAKVTDAQLDAIVAPADAVINCIGITKPHVSDDDIGQVLVAIEVNSAFPNRLAKAIQGTDTRVIQIATDCVYSGKKGGYAEGDYHDAYDVYGKSKSLGEARQDNFTNLRCSIVGPEKREQKMFLLEWFTTQPKQAKLRGFTNHEWNGISTLHFAKICVAMVRDDISIGNLQHIVPQGAVSKHELLGIFQERYGREDIVIEPVATDMVVNRTLATSSPEINGSLWRAAGYQQIPTVAEMMSELSECEF